MSLLSREAILKADDLVTEDVDVPEWGGTVRVKALTGAERDKLESSVVEQKGNKQRMNLTNFRAKLVASSIIDEKGHPLFDEKDIRQLAAKSAGALDRVSTVASRISGMSDEDVEELTEGFDSAPSERSTSA